MKISPPNNNFSRSYKRSESYLDLLVWGWIFVHGYRYILGFFVEKRLPVTIERLAVINGKQIEFKIMNYVVYILKNYLSGFPIFREIA